MPPIEPVHSKPNFYRRFIANEFGNRSQMWDSVEECLSSGYCGLVTIRSKIPGGPCYYDLLLEDLEPFWGDCMYAGLKPGDLTIGAAMPARDVIFSGELSYNCDGRLHMRWSRVADHHRHAMQAAQDAWGPAVWALIHQYCNQASEDWLRHLLETYENHAIEFSTLRYCWGTVPGHNTIYWEVRAY